MIVLTARSAAELWVRVETVEPAAAALIRTLQQAGLLVLLVSRHSIGGDETIDEAIPGVAGVVSYADDQYEGLRAPLWKRSKQRIRGRSFGWASPETSSLASSPDFSNGYPPEQYSYRSDRMPSARD